MAFDLKALHSKNAESSSNPFYMALSTMKRIDGDVSNRPDSDETYAIAPIEDTLVDIIEHVAALEETAVCDLPPLYESVDPDLLDAVLESGEVTVSFSYCGYAVSVQSDGLLIVSEDRDPPPTP